MIGRGREAVRNMLLGTVSLFKRDFGPKTLIYHDIFGQREYTDMGTPLMTFKRHLAVAKELGFSFSIGLPLAERELQICLDDGFRGIWDVQDFFVVNQIFPTVFIATDLVGKEGFLSWPEILTLQEKGFVFESHTCSHRTLNRFSANELWHELYDSRLTLSDKLGKDVRQICFPQGGFSRLVYDESIRAGYDVMYSCVPGNVTKPILGLKGVVRRNLVQFSNGFGFRGVLGGALGVFDRHYIQLHYR